MYENLIVVCYIGGARGDAISYIIELSPEVYTRNSKILAVPNQHGSMVILMTRYGHQSLDGSTIGWSTASYQDANDMHWGFLDEVAGTVAEEWQRVVPELWFDIPRRVRFKDALSINRLVVADHANPTHIRQFLPGTKTVAVIGDADAAFELFKAKHLLMKPERWYRDSPSYNVRTNLDRYIAGGRDTNKFPITDAERSDRLAEIRDSWHRRFNGMRQDTDSFALDFDSLFDNNINHAVYHQLIEYLGLTPNWTAAKEFIDIYNAAQPF
jgi:hypothetical protein